MTKSGAEAAAASQIHQPARTVSLAETGVGTVPLIIKSKSVPAAVEFMQREVIVDAEEYPQAGNSRTTRRATPAPPNLAGASSGGDKKDYQG